MNTKMFKLLTAGAFALLSVACGDNAIEASDYKQNDPVQTTATLNVVVKDQASGAPLAASVQLLSTGGTATTDLTTGTASFKEVPVGAHRVLVNASGYASAIWTGSITGTANGTAQSIYIAQEGVVDVKLYPLTAGLDGYVFYEDAKGGTKAATNAWVRFIANENLNLVNNIDSAKVDGTGKFTFTKLPAVGVGYTLQVVEVNAADGLKYRAKERYPSTALADGEYLRAGTTAHLKGQINYSASDLVGLFELTNYNAVLKSTDTLFLEFSEAIDAAKFKGGDIVFNPTTIVTEKIVDGKKLKLVNADKWPNNFTFYFNGLTSVNGMTPTTVNNLATAKTVRVEGTFDLISYTTVLNGASDTLFLEFSDVIDATKFKSSMVFLSDDIVANKIVDGKVLKIVPSEKWPSSFTFNFSNASGSYLTSVNGMTVTGFSTPKTVSVDGIFDLVKYTTVLESGKDTLFLEFSDEIDPAKFKIGQVHLIDVSTPVERIVDRKVLKLVPSDNWPSSFKFYFANDGGFLTSVKGMSVTSFSTPKTVIIKGTFELMKYTTVLEKGSDTLFLEFSGEIDKTKFKADMVTFSSTSSDNIIAKKILDGSKLKLVPAGQWPNSFTFSINEINGNKFMSVNGMDYSTNNRPVSVAGTFDLISYTTYLKGADTLFLEFSDKIDATKFKAGMVQLDPNTIIANRIVEDNKLKLVPTDKWPSNFSFYLNSVSNTYITSVNGAIYTNTDWRPVSVEGSFDLVKYNNVLKSTDALVLEFSDEIDATKFKAEMIQFDDYYPYTMPITQKIVDGNKLKVVAASAWPSTFQFYLTNPGGNYITSVNGATYTNGNWRPVSVEGTFNLTGYTATLKGTDTLFLEFSDAIDATKFKPTMVSIQNSNTYVAEKIVDGNKLKLWTPNGWPSPSFTFRISTGESGLTSVNGLTLVGTANGTVNLEGSFNLLSYKTTIKSTDELVLEFSDEIDADAFKANMVGVNYSNITPTFERIVEGKKLRIVSSNRFNRTNYFSLSINSIKSVNGISYSGNTNEITIERPTFTVTKFLPISDKVPVSANYVLPLTKLDTTLVLVFTDSIDQALFRPNMVSISGVVLSDRIVKGDTLKLVSPNKWPSRFTVSFSDLISVNGVTYDGGSKVIEQEQVDLTAVQITGLMQSNGSGLPDTSDFNSDYVYLKWNRVEGADGYRVYAKATAGTNNIAFLRSFNQSSQPTVEQYLDLGGNCIEVGDYYFYNWNTNYPALGPITPSLQKDRKCVFAEGNTVQFIVQAYNNISETDLKGTAVAKLTVGDKKKPRLISGWSQAGGDSVAYWNGYYPRTTNCDYLDHSEIYQCEYSTYNSDYGIYSNGTNSFKFDKLNYTPAFSYSAALEAYYGTGYHYATIQFSEPMDTNNVSIAYVSDDAIVTTVPARFTIKKSWSPNGKNLYLDPDIAITIGPAENKDFKFRVQIGGAAGFTDASGNVLSQSAALENNIGEYTLSPGSRKVKTNKLEYRFEHLGNPDPDYDPSPIAP